MCVAHHGQPFVSLRYFALPWDLILHPGHCELLRMLHSPLNKRNWYFLNLGKTKAIASERRKQTIPKLGESSGAL